MKGVAVYPGTFDPITNGHVDLIKRCLFIFDKVIVSVAPSAKKAPLFTIDERLEMIREVAAEIGGDIVAVPFDGLLVEHVLGADACVVIRGLRAVSDFEYEMQMALMNRRLSNQVETVFMMPSEEYTYISSSVIKEVAGFGGDVSGLVPDSVQARLKRKFAG